MGENVDSLSSGIARRPFLAGTATLAAGALGSRYAVERVSAASADSLGSAVAISIHPKFGVYYAAGAPGDDEVRPNAGAVSVFRRGKTGPTDISRLTATDGDVGDRFGHAVTMDTDRARQYVFVGAPGEREQGSNAGAVYAYRGRPGNPTDWSQYWKFTALDGRPGDELGHALAAAGEYIVVGAPGADGNVGAAYVLDDRGSQSYRLVPRDGAPADRFGTAVATDGRYFLVGAPGAGNTGAAYLFDGKKQVAKLVPSDAAGGDRFGTAVAAGQYLAIGAPNASTENGRTGRVYVYRSRKPILFTTLEPQDGAPGDRFGAAVDTEGASILVGEPGGSSGGGGTAGAAFLYTLKGDRVGRFIATDADQGDNLGTAVAMAANELIVGSPGDDDVAANSGAAYVFELRYDPLLSKFTG
ncbi:FG-GAP repeat protein [Salinigranum halophilum]|uniref:FG-GAP repeat protein n=1 Tax=Salinigranum halophilum TaxID=2565931 RepID=UPI0013760D75|nr:FG-GAP repeat protein [Salinigranum halophilum]